MNEPGSGCEGPAFPSRSSGEGRGLPGWRWWSRFAAPVTPLVNWCGLMQAEGGSLQHPWCFDCPGQCRACQGLSSSAIPSLERVCAHAAHRNTALVRSLPPSRAPRSTPGLRSSSDKTQHNLPTFIFFAFVRTCSSLYFSSRCHRDSYSPLVCDLLGREKKEFPYSLVLPRVGVCPVLTGCSFPARSVNISDR